MDKNLKNLESAFNHLEHHTQLASHMYMMDSELPIHSDNSQANVALEFNKLMNKITKLYGKSFTKHVLSHLGIVTTSAMEKAIPILKKKFKHNQYADFFTDGIKAFRKEHAQYVRFDTSDGSMVDFDYIRYEDVRLILNLFRIALHIPISKTHLFYELVNDLNLNESSLDNAQFDSQPSGSWDAGEIEMDCSIAIGENQDGIKEVTPLITQILELSKDKHQLYQFTKFSRKYCDSNADYPWMIKEKFQAVPHSINNKKVNLPKNQFTKDQVISDMIKRPASVIIKYHKSDYRLRNDYDVCVDTGAKLVEEIQDVLDLVNDDTNRFGKDKKGDYYPITFFSLNRHDLHQLKTVYQKIKNIPDKIDKWAKKVDPDFNDRWDELYKKEEKVVKLLNKCKFRNPKIMKHFKNIFDCIKHQDTYDGFNNDGYYYAYNVKTIVDIIRKILNEQKA